MREMIKMVVVLTVLSAFSGGLLAAVRNGTKDRIKDQQLKFVKGPAIESILEGASNELITDRISIKDGDTDRDIFIGVFDGKANTVTFETFGKGFGGDVGVMVGVNLENDNVVGIGVTTHSETPGLGSKAQTEPGFAAQFKGKSLNEPFNVKSAGGQIDALSGATVTSQAVCAAVTEAGKVYKKLKSQITGDAEAFINQKRQ